MCFSILLENDMNKLAKKFGASLSKSSIDHFHEMQQLESQLDPQDLKKQMGLKRKPSSPLFKLPKDNGRVFPGYFLPGLVLHQKQRQFHYMRYRVRPAGSSEEIPSKYNVFNARKDALQTRKTWKGLFLKKHALIPFVSFYEWVEHKGKKTLIRFYPTKHDIMWAPALYDTWISEDGRISFLSCAIITTEPPPEVQRAGHDRCPIFLNHHHIDTWLNAEKLNSETALEILSNLEPEKYDNEFVGN